MVEPADSRTPSASDLPAWVKVIALGVEIALHVQPGASVGVHAQRLKVALQAPPVEGRANEALVRFLAAMLGVAPRQVVLVGGERSRDKRVELHGVEAAAAMRALAPIGSHE